MRPKLIWGILLLIGGVVALSIATAPLVAAYQFLGGRWPAPEGISYLRIQVGATYLSDGLAWSAALRDWYNTPTPFGYTVVNYMPDVQLTDDWVPGASWDGIMYNYPCLTCEYYLSYGYLNAYHTVSYSSEKVRSVTAHEIGHTFGLDHEVGPVLMNGRTCGTLSRWCTYGINTPQQDDINGVNAIY